MSEIYYKVLDENGEAFHGGTGQWSLPTRNEDGTWTPGKWMPPVKGKIKACRNGYHGCGLLDLFDWLGPRIFVMEYKRAPKVAGNKVVGRQARLLSETAWDERAARLFACDCAERVLPIFEQHQPNDDRPRKAIEVARRFANGRATRGELDAAWDAAWCAARAAAWAAAGDAAGAAAWAAAWAAAGDAAWAAAWDAAWCAAGAAEREWQAARLLQYLNGGAE